MTTTTTFHGLGADNTLTVYADGANELLNQSVSMIQAYAHLLSLYDDESLLTMINAQAGKTPVHIPVRPVFNLIAQAVAWSKRGLGYNALIGRSSSYGELALPMRAFHPPMKLMQP